MGRFSPDGAYEVKAHPRRIVMPANVSNVKDLFLAVLDVPVAERGEYLDSACAGDAKLREQVEAMLRCHANSGELLSRPAAEMRRNGPCDTDVSGADAPPSDPSATVCESPAGDTKELAFLAPAAK